MAEKQAPAARAAVVQKPEPVNPGELAAKAIADAEEARKAEAAAAAAPDMAHLPASVVAEMEAGKAALQRHAPKAS